MSYRGFSVGEGGGEGVIVCMEYGIWDLVFVVRLLSGECEEGLVGLGMGIGVFIWNSSGKMFLLWEVLGSWVLGLG